MSKELIEKWAMFTVWWVLAELSPSSPHWERNEQRCVIELVAACQIVFTSQDSEQGSQRTPGLNAGPTQLL